MGPWDGNPSIFESDRSDKPSWARSSSKTFNEGAGIRRQQLRTLKSLDDTADSIMTLLEALGEGADTVAIFTSDDGSSGASTGSPRAAPASPLLDPAIRATRPLPQRNRLRPGPL